MQTNEIILRDSEQETKEQREEILKLYKKAFRARGYGLEHRMEFGRALAALKYAMRHRQPGDFIELATIGLELKEHDVYYRIQLSATWDAIELRLRDTPIAMPTFEAHIAALFPLKDLSRRAEAWAQLKENSERDQSRVTSETVAIFVEKFAALPVDATVLQTDLFEKKEAATLSETDDNLESDLDSELAKTELGLEPSPTTTAAAAPDGDTAPAGEGPEYKRSEKGVEAINRIAKLCGPSWRDALSDPLKVLDRDVIAWAAEKDEDVKKIAALVGPPIGKGIQRSIKYLHNVIDEKTPLGDLKNRAIALGGHWEHEMVGFKYTVDRLD